MGSIEIVRYFEAYIFIKVPTKRISVVKKIGNSKHELLQSIIISFTV